MRINAICPKQVANVRHFAVSDELVLVKPQDTDESKNEDSGNQAITLNQSGRAIWDLCNGNRNIGEMADTLEKQYSVKSDILLPHIVSALGQMWRSGFLERPGKLDIADTVFVIGIEDKPKFWWQAAIFLESFVGKLPPGWGTHVVVCNNGHEISAELKNILEKYDTEFSQATNHADTYPLDTGNRGGENHSALNRIEALSSAAKKVDEETIICLLDSDIFLYGPLNFEIMPQRNALARNWHIENEPFFSSVAVNNGFGINLRKMLEALGCKQEFQPGGVNVFVTGAVAKNSKFITDCFRFAHSLFMLARTANVTLAWIAEMPCFAMSLTANNIEYDLLEQKEFLVSDCDEQSIPPGTFYHYYSDPGDFGRTAFYKSKWYKQAYTNHNFLHVDFSEYQQNAVSEHEKYFFQLASASRERLNV